MNKLIKTNGCMLTDRTTDYKNVQNDWSDNEYFNIEGMIEVFHIPDDYFNPHDDLIKFYGKLTLDNGDIQEGLFETYDANLFYMGDIEKLYMKYDKNGNGELMIVTREKGPESVDVMMGANLVIGSITYKNGYKESGVWKLGEYTGDTEYTEDYKRYFHNATTERVGTLNQICGEGVVHVVNREE
jgi:hypothetical protein